MESAEILADEEPEKSSDVGINNKVAEEIAKKLRMMMALKLCKEDNTPNEVIPGLFIGSIGSALNKTALKDHGITHILCVADKINPAFPTEFIYKAIRILDSPDVNLLLYLQECFDFICYGLAAGKILVHW